jgi:chemotaxis protein methyltransferase CheR
MQVSQHRDRGSTRAGPSDAPKREFSFTDADFRAIATRIRDVSGIVLQDSKQDLVYGRLAKRLRKLGCGSFAEYLRLLHGPDAVEERTALVNALTTNLTGFFREKHHFEALEQKFLPEIRARSQARRLRIWSAGCSSGQEPYSIAMVLAGALPDIDRWDALVLASDIDSNMVETARAGIYDAEAAESIPDRVRRKHVIELDDGQVAMSPPLRALIRFRRLNLLAPWPMSGPFDIIFCRNVVIYFDKETQRGLFNRFADMLRPDGWLVIGHSESLFRVSDRFAHLGQTIYRRTK